MLTMREPIVSTPHGFSGLTETPVVRHNRVMVTRYVVPEGAAGWPHGVLATNPWSDRSLAITCPYVASGRLRQARKAL